MAAPVFWMVFPLKLALFQQLLDHARHLAFVAASLLHQHLLRDAGLLLAYLQQTQQHGWHGGMVPQFVVQGALDTAEQRHQGRQCLLGARSDSWVHIHLVDIINYMDYNVDIVN